MSRARMLRIEIRAAEIAAVMLDRECRGVRVNGYGFHWRPGELNGWMSCAAWSRYDRGNKAVGSDAWHAGWLAAIIFSESRDSRVRPWVPADPVSEATR